MLLIGCRPSGRHTEQHDVFFGIAESPKGLIPYVNAFWPEAKGKLHIDAWREVTAVNGYGIEVTDRTVHQKQIQSQQLYFINLGGYQPGVFDEPHFKMITVQAGKAAAIQFAKTTPFYRDVQFDKAVSHVDDKFGVDVDDLYEIEDILPHDQKARFWLKITPLITSVEDELHLGYFKLSTLI